jgi:hypothetical protein
LREGATFVFPLFGLFRGGIDGHLDVLQWREMPEGCLRKNVGKRMADMVGA